MEQKFDLNDILIVPSSISKISSRKEVNPFVNGFLPLITAPMDTVINSENEKIFYLNKIITCLPRGEKSSFGFTSYSLDEMINLYINDKLNNKGYYLIDIANGHMLDLEIAINQIKTKYPDLTLMVGNIANPETYRRLSDAGADLIRCGIGNGNACTTTFHTGVGYPLGSLISECYNISCQINNPAKIVADGGMKTYSDIIKALALGADYVMVGSLFNKTIESTGDNYLFNLFKVNNTIAKLAYNYKLPVYKKFRGMSTKEVQKKWGKKNLTTSEGVVRIRKVEYTLNKWVDNFIDYLRSSMSYTNSTTLDEFTSKSKIIQITNNSYNRFNK